MSSPTTKQTERGFTLVELLVTMVVSALVVTSFSTFYLSEQRAARRQQVEIESSQALRTVLEQICRDLRPAGKNVTGATLPFTTADTSSVEFKLDANDDGTPSDTDPDEHKGFQLTGTTVEQLHADPGGNTWNALADNISSLQFTYRDCAGSALTAPVATLGDIASVDVAVTVTRPASIGLPLTRTEVDSVRLRNKRCP